MGPVQEGNNGMKLKSEITDDAREAIRARFSNRFSVFQDIRRALSPAEWVVYAKEWPLCGPHGDLYSGAWHLWGFVQPEEEYPAYRHYGDPFRRPLAFFEELDPAEFVPPDLANVEPHGEAEDIAVIRARARFWLDNHLPQNPNEQQWLIDHKVTGR
jgi:hypothetical protein